MKWPLIRILPHHFSFDFVKLAPFAAVVSAILIIGSGVAWVTEGMNLGTDFAGGTQIIIQTNGPPPLAALRASAGHDAVVKTYGANAAAVTFKQAPGVDPIKGAEAVRQKLLSQFPGSTANVGSAVGPAVSGELMVKGFMALGIAMGLMLLYIWFRFQLQFGLGAVVAIIHDVILTLGLLIVTRQEFSMESIAALLTVIGYSMNEKVITFDRLRENLRKFKKTPLRDVINLSENERLSRTIITGTTALLALSGMLFLGGPALFSLIMTMVFGIIIGTYSSIYVALPVILLWGVKKNDDEAVPIKPMNVR